MLRPLPKAPESPQDFAKLHYSKLAQQLPLLLSESAQSAYFEGLPYYPYCTEKFEYGIKRLPRNLAALRKHIQHNPDSMVRCLVFDIDSVDGYDRWEDVGCPAPNWIILNPQNGHAHYLYVLECPVPFTDASRKKPRDYVAAIERGLSHRLGADIGYAGFISKNPLHPHWRTLSVHEYAYPLSELADYVNLKLPKQKKREVSGLGRNCMIFDEARYWSYPRVNAAKEQGNFSQWFSEVFEKVKRCNTFDNPLDIAELHTIAKSIARWTWKNYDRKSKNRGAASKQYCLFNWEQLDTSEKQACGASYTHKTRKQRTESKIRDAIAQLKAENKRVTRVAVARIAGVSDRTIRKNYRHLF